MFISTTNLPDEIETNKFATMGEQPEIEDDIQVVQNESSSESTNMIQPPPRPSLMARFKDKMKQLKEGVKVPVVKKFNTYLALYGFLPSFNEFLYFFAIDRLHLSKFEIGASSSVNGILIIVIPIVYQKYFSQREYRFMFTSSIILQIIQSLFMLGMALGLTA